MNKTFMDEYKDYDISVLCIDRDNGWDADCAVHKDGNQIMPTRRLSHDHLFKTQEKAKEAGLEFCQKFVDGLNK